MKVLSQTLALLIGLALLAALGFVGYRVVMIIGGLFASLDSQVARITAIVSVVALLASVIIARGIRATGEQNEADRLFEEKAKTYRLLIDSWYVLLRQGGGADDRSRAQASEELRSLERLLALYGSASAIKAHTALRTLARDRGAQSPEARSQFARVLLEIRKDLGSGTVGLTAEDLQQLLFDDSDKVSASASASAFQDGQFRLTLTSTS
jgi:hypothetical protein